MHGSRREHDADTGPDRGGVGVLDVGTDQLCRVRPGDLGEDLIDCTRQLVARIGGVGPGHRTADQLDHVGPLARPAHPRAPSGAEGVPQTRGDDIARGDHRDEEILELGPVQDRRGGVQVTVMCHVVPSPAAGSPAAA